MWLVPIFKERRVLRESMNRRNFIKLGAMLGAVPAAVAGLFKGSVADVGRVETPLTVQSLQGWVEMAKAKQAASEWYCLWAETIKFTCNKSGMRNV